MHLVQILLPIADRQGNSLESEIFDEVRRRLVENFGGVTFYLNAPAEGIWKTETGSDRDQIVTAEVMTKDLDPLWWRAYRWELERMFDQEEIVVRSLVIQRL